MKKLLIGIAVSVLALASLAGVSAYGDDWVATEIVTPGDVNLDGAVDLQDAQLIQYIVAGLPVNQPAYLNGDVNCDGETTLHDALLITLDVAGFETKPCAER